MRKRVVVIIILQEIIFSTDKNRFVLLKIGIMGGVFAKVLDCRKVDMKAKQPLSIYYKLGALLILPVWRQGNQIGEYFNV